VPVRRLAFAVVMVGVAVVPPASQATSDGPDYKAGTLQVLDLYLKGDYETVCAYFSEEVASQVRPADLGKSWKYVQEAAGPFQSLGDPVLTAGGKYHIVTVPANFQWQKWEFVATWDAEGALAGFLLRPSTQADRTPSPAPSTKPAAPGSEGPSESGDQHPELLGHWEGKIEIPGSPLIMKLDLSWENRQWSGSVSSPMQSDASFPIAGLHVNGADLAFSIEGIPGNPSFRGKYEEGTLKGTFSQSGQQFACSFGRASAHPQEPQPPFPYTEETVSFQSGDVKLEGTLTLPPGRGMLPAVLLISGSGAQDRDETILGHKPFLVLADDLTRAGIAVLRVDDRGVGGSTGGASMPTTEDFVDDALAGVTFLQGRKGIDPKKVGLIGHSEGGVIAAMAAARSDQVAFVVMLAGPGLPGDEVLVRQMELIYRAEGMDPDTLESMLAVQRKVLDLTASGASAGEIQNEVRRLVEIQTADNKELASLSQEERDGAIEAATTQAVAQLMLPWFRFFLGYDPREALREVHVPVLALIGERDLQVDPKQNLPEIRKALEAAGDPDVTVRELAGLNHLFQKAESGSPSEYAAIQETIDPAALEAIRDWILARFGSD
jgi:pimeloyl-ACP methyl ester carboxylesterase